MSASACPLPPARVPGPSSTAPCPRRHGMSTGEPALTTTTVRSLTSSTASTSSRCRPGRDRSGRSCPSGLPLPVGADDDHRDVGPPPAAATARSNSSPVSGGAAPMRAPMIGDEAAARPDVHGQLVGTTGRQVERDLDRLAPRAVEAEPRAGSVLSTTTSPSRRRTARPALSRPQPPRSGHLGHERGRQPDRALPDGQVGMWWADPQHPGGVGQLRRHRHALEVRVVEVRDLQGPVGEQAQVDGRQAPVDPASHLGDHQLSGSCSATASSTRRRR